MTDLSDPLEYVTPEVLADFGGAGTQSLINALHNPDAPPESANDIKSQIYTELILVALELRITADDLARFLGSSITDESLAVLFCQVCDVFPLDELLKSLLKAVIGDLSAIKSSTAVANLDSATALQLELLPGDGFNRQLNTRKRDLLFTQKKFNLLHVEYEGYTLLVNELCTVLDNKHNMYLVSHTLSMVELLMGHYLLDPNRVLDLILEVFANYIIGNHDFIIAFLKESKWWPKIPACSDSLHALSTGGSDTAAKCIALRLVKLPRDKDLVETYKLMVTILIKEGFVSFGQIYSFFPPGDAEMKSLEELYLKELEEKVFRSSASALALAAPLIEEESEGQSENESKKPDSEITESVLTVSQLAKLNVKFQMLKALLTNGLYWPSIYILAQYPYLVHIDEEISELLHRMLDAIISPLFNKISSISKADVDSLTSQKQVPVTRHSDKVTWQAPENKLLFCFKPTAKAFGNKEVVFFYDRWTIGLPEVQSPAQLATFLSEFVKFFGPIIANDVANFSMLCDIISASLLDLSSDEAQLWFDNFRNYIFPYIGLLEENAVAEDKAFLVLEKFSTDDRFNLYGELLQVTAKNNPYIKIAHGKAEKSTKDVLKRLSKENVGPMMRRLAKISFANPLPCFLTIIQQLESYDNLISLVVDAAVYFNAYGWDNITLAILLRLTASGRSNVKANGLNERQWLQSLSAFIGRICQKYPHRVDVASILGFLIRSFHAGRNSDLIVLKEILAQMGGFQPMTNLTPLQITMMSCGSTLRKLVCKTIFDERHSRQDSGKKLSSVLCEIKGINELFVLLWKMSSHLVDTLNSSHLKALAKQKDELDAVMHLFCALIGEFPESAEAHLMKIDDLLAQFGVSVVWTMELWRPFLKTSSFSSLKTSLSSQMNSSPIHLVGLDAYAAFWMLSLHDIDYDETLYASETSKLESKKAGLAEELNFIRKSKSSTPKDISKIKDNIRELEVFIDNIPDEKSKHKDHAEDINLFLSSTIISQLATSSKEDIVAFEHGFLQQCILPRAVHSSFDALFCSKFLFKLHEMNKSNFSITGTLDNLFTGQALFGTLFTCTPVEAENMGLFVALILKELHLWTTQNTFDQKMALSAIRIGSEKMSFGVFRKKLYDYHVFILEDVLRALTVTTYMSRMNGITFLKNLLGVYPIVEDHCERIITIMDSIAKNESRDDLKLSSSALVGHVKSRKNCWVHLWDFIDMSEDDKSAQVEKRRAIEEEAKKKLKKAEEARNMAQKREQERIEKEQAAKVQLAEQQALEEKAANAIRYDEGSAQATQRLLTRTAGDTKKRYDYYSKYEENAVKPQADEKKSHPSSASAAVSQKRDFQDLSGDKTLEKVQTETDLFGKKISSKESRDPARVDSRPAVNTQLKSRLAEAKSELKLKAKAAKPDAAAEPEKRDFRLPPQGPRKSTDPAGTTTPRNTATSRTALPPQRPPRERAPLPPQLAPKPRTLLPPQRPPREFGDRNSGVGRKMERDSHSNGFGERPRPKGKSRAASNTDPLPPPPLPPPSQSDNRAQADQKRRSGSNYEGQKRARR